MRARMLRPHGGRVGRGAVCKLARICSNNSAAKGASVPTSAIIGNLRHSFHSNPLGEVLVGGSFLANSWGLLGKVKAYRPPYQAHKNLHGARDPSASGALCRLAVKANGCNSKMQQNPKGFENLPIFAFSPINTGVNSYKFRIVLVVKRADAIRGSRG